MFNKMRLQQGFTLMEIMIVVIIIGIIAGLSLPNYHRATERSHMQDAMTKLRMIHKAQEMYCVKTNKYFPGLGLFEPRDISEINSGLNLSLSSNGFTYQCVSSTAYCSDPLYGTFNCYADRGPGYNYRLDVYQTALDNLNPRCSGSGCP